MLRQYEKRLICAVLSCCMILTCGTACSSDSSVSSTSGNSDTAAGLAYLQSLDNIDLASIDATLTWQHEHNLEEMHEELLSQLENGEISCWSLFEDYLMCGDSRFIPLSYDGFLPESNVWADYGKTIDTLQSMESDIVARAPAHLFLDYGMNDFCSGDWNDPDVWAQSYTDIIRDLQSQLPTLKVYVCSIIPATDALTAEESLWTVIPNYNNALAQAVADMEGVCYIDCTELGEAHQDLYQDDSKHFESEFYEYWGTEMIMAMYDFEFDDGSSDSANTSEAPAGTSEISEITADAGTENLTDSADTDNTTATD